jgi:uroporphyrinogen-III synthase
MLVLVTRPQEQADETARLLRRAGHEPLLDPLLRIVRLPPPAVEPRSIAAVAVTSANAVPALSALPPTVPVFAVGKATALALRAAGREVAGIAAGDGHALAALLSGSLPAGSAVLHLCGRDVREGLAEDLTAAGLAYWRAVVYEAAPAERLAPTTEAALRALRLDAVLLFSPRTAALFTTLIRATGLVPGLERVIVACLSEAVAAELAGLPFRAVRVAEARDQKALLRRLDG